MRRLLRRSSLDKEMPHLAEEWRLQQPDTLDPQLVLRNHGVGGDRLQKYKVYEEIDESEYDPELQDPIVDGRWIHEEKRSRVVAKHFKRKTNDTDPHLNYGGTPVSHGLRCLLSIAAEDEEREMVLHDAESACHQSKAKENMYGRLPVMRGPEDICKRKTLWRLHQGMPGMQDAGRC